MAYRQSIALAWKKDKYYCQGIYLLGDYTKMLFKKQQLQRKNSKFWKEEPEGLASDNIKNKKEKKL